jgi:acetyl-CoA carboxylase carboxyl transferase subunit alpha
MKATWLDFEKPIVELERRIEDLRHLATEENLEIHQQVRDLEATADKLRREIYSSLSRWQRVQLARHPRRPYTLDYIGMLMPDFLELHGDRGYADDKSIVGGMATFEGRPVVVIGHQKGRDTKENLYRNFGMPHPEGYRKALRLMQLAEKFGNPVITLIDTPGAYPGIGAEERGQSEAIARNLREMARLRVPIIAVVIGEGGSGGALALGVADAVLMLENAIYSVISPEGCAAILWSDRAKAPEAAEAMKLTAADIVKFGVIDEVLEEPMGGAHWDAEATGAVLRSAMARHLERLGALPTQELLDRRLEKYLHMGVVVEE